MIEGRGAVDMVGKVVRFAHFPAKPAGSARSGNRFR